MTYRDFRRAALVLSAAFLMAIAVLTWWIDTTEDRYRSQAFVLMSYDGWMSQYEIILEASEGGADNNTQDLQLLKQDFVAGIFFTLVELGLENEEYRMLYDDIETELGIDFDSPSFGEYRWLQTVLTQPTLAQDLRDAGPLLIQLRHSLGEDLHARHMQILLMRDYRSLLLALILISLGLVFVAAELESRQQKTPA